MALFVWYFIRSLGTRCKAKNMNNFLLLQFEMLLQHVSPNDKNICPIKLNLVKLISSAILCIFLISVNLFAWIYSEGNEIFVLTKLWIWVFSWKPSGTWKKVFLLRPCQVDFLFSINVHIQNHPRHLFILFNF